MSAARDAKLPKLLGFAGHFFVMTFVPNMECYDGFDPLRTAGGCLAAIAAFSIVRLS